MRAAKFTQRRSAKTPRSLISAVKRNLVSLINNYGIISEFSHQEMGEVQRPQSLIAIALRTTSIAMRCEVYIKLTRQPVLEVSKLVFIIVDSEGNPAPHNKSKSVT